MSRYRYLPRTRSLYDAGSGCPATRPHFGSPPSLLHRRALPKYRPVLNSYRSVWYIRVPESRPGWGPLRQPHRILQLTCNVPGPRGASPRTGRRGFHTCLRQFHCSKCLFLGLIWCTSSCPHTCWTPCRYLCHRGITSLVGVVESVPLDSVAADVSAPAKGSRVSFRLTTLHVYTRFGRNPLVPSRRVP